MNQPSPFPTVLAPSQGFFSENAAVRSGNLTRAERQSIFDSLNSVGRSIEAPFGQDKETWRRVASSWRALEHAFTQEGNTADGVYDLIDLDVYLESLQDSLLGVHRDPDEWGSMATQIATLCTARYLVNDALATARGDDEGTKEISSLKTALKDYSDLCTCDAHNIMKSELTALGVEAQA